jgi:1-acyl-sn-glycerol-3-phosphate acyltransferase
MIVLRYLWRFWFYFLTIITILILLPILILTILSDKTYKLFFGIARIWAYIIFYGMGMRYTLERDYKPIKNNSYIIVANHASMLDIMLMLILVKDNPFVFVGKAELSKIPIFGFIYKRTCILVDRANSKSRNDVYLSARDKINNGLSICIFPEGGVTDDPDVLLDDFKEGAFRLALEHKLPILPLTFYGLKYYFPFINSVGKPGRVLAKIHEPIIVEKLALNEKKTVKNQTHQLILDQLILYKSKNPL